MILSIRFTSFLIFTFPSTLPAAETFSLNIEPAALVNTDRYQNPSVANDRDPFDTQANRRTMLFST